MTFTIEILETSPSNFISKILALDVLKKLQFHPNVYPVCLLLNHCLQAVVALSGWLWNRTKWGVAAFSAKTKFKFKRFSEGE